MMEEMCIAFGVVAVSARFVYQFLDKYHTRHIGPGPQSVSRHRHPNNERHKRGGEVKEFDTMDLSKIQRELDNRTYFSETASTRVIRALQDTDPEKTIIIEG